MTPFVTILMPVYNGEKFIVDAIESILNQTYGNFEFIIIDDGSTDRSVEIIKDFNDKRIRLLQNNRNLGLVKTLNKGFEAAQGKYIIRMDCDDISLPERLKKQVAYMEAHPEIAISGCWVQLIKGTERKEIWRYPTEPAELKCKLLFNNVLVHSSVIIRQELLLQKNLKYASEFTQAEDYGLWVNVAKVSQLGNLGEVLHLYRIHPLQAMQVRNNDISQDAKKIRIFQLEKLGLKPAIEEILIHEALCNNSYQPSRDFVLKVESWLLKIKRANKIADIYSKQALDYVLGEYWVETCWASKNQGFWIIYKYMFSRLSFSIRFPVKQRLRFMASLGKSGIINLKNRLSFNKT